MVRAKGAHKGGEADDDRLGGFCGEESGGGGDRGGDHCGGLLLGQDEESLEEGEGGTGFGGSLQEAARILVENVHRRCLLCQQLLLDPAIPYRPP